jgi:very-short-patch-repair endonuclease
MDLFKYNKKLKERARLLRNKSTLSEIILWNKLKKRQVGGLQFLRQKIISNYIVDFYCPELKLAIEVDGAIHSQKKGLDDFRQGELEGLGIKVIRFRDREVMRDIDNVIQEITSLTTSPRCPSISSGQSPSSEEGFPSIKFP